MIPNFIVFEELDLKFRTSALTLIDFCPRIGFHLLIFCLPLNNIVSIDNAGVKNVTPMYSIRTVINRIHAPIDVIGATISPNPIDTNPRTTKKIVFFLISELLICL
jgi:hypothetical protein